MWQQCTHPSTGTRNYMILISSTATKPPGLALAALDSSNPSSMHFVTSKGKATTLSKTRLFHSSQLKCVVQHISAFISFRSKALLNCSPEATNH